MNKVNFNNETVRQAVNEWINEEKLAESKYGHISKWDTSEEVTDMNFLFSKADAFNQDIGNWDVISVNMKRMFCFAESFNQDIGNWDASNMESMFKEAKAFKQNLGNWNLSKDAGISLMFD